MKPMLSLVACLLLGACTGTTSTPPVPGPAGGGAGASPVATAAPPRAAGPAPGNGTIPAGAGFCAEGEEVVFGCSVEGGRAVALCASSGFAEGGGSLEYRETSGVEPVRTWPSRAMAPAEAFRSGTLMYSGGGGAFLRFDDAGATYTVYTGIGRGWEKAGVEVRAGDSVTSLPCRGPAQSRIGPDLFERAGIPADAEGFEIP